MEVARLPLARQPYRGAGAHGRLERQYLLQAAHNQCGAAGRNVQAVAGGGGDLSPAGNTVMMAGSFHESNRNMSARPRARVKAKPYGWSDAWVAYDPIVKAAFIGVARNKARRCCRPALCIPRPTTDSCQRLPGKIRVGISARAWVSKVLVGSTSAAMPT